MGKDNDSHMDNHLRQHLRRKTPAERNFGGTSPQPHSNRAKGRGEELKHMPESYPSNGKGFSNLFYCRSTDDNEGPFP